MSCSPRNRSPRRHRRAAVAAVLALAAVLGPQTAAGLESAGLSATADCEATVTAAIAADAWIDEGSPTSNKGSDSILNVDGGSVNIDTNVVSGRTRTLLRFHMPGAVPLGCVVESARLHLFSPEENVGARAEVLRLESGWSEGSVSWDSQPPAVGAPVASWSRQGYMQWNVTSQVEAMYAPDGVNHGFLVRDAAEGGESSGEHNFHGREKGDANDEPFLAIRFAEPSSGEPEPPQPPVATPVHCGQVLTQSTLATNNLACSGDGLVIGAARIVVDLGGHTIAGTGLGTGVRNDGFGSVTVKNGTIERFDYGVRLSPETTFNVVEALTLRGNEVAAVELFDVAGTVVHGNTLDGNDGGISLVSGTTGSVVSDNTVTANGKAGLLVRDAGGNRLEGNTVSGGGDLGIGLERADGNAVIGNVVAGNSDGGIELLEGSDGNYLEGNTVTDSGDHGILVSASAGNALVENTTWNMSDSGIAFDVVVDSVAWGNDVRFNTGGLQIDGSSGNVVESNDASNTTGIGIELGGGSYENVIRLNTANENAAIGIYVADEALAGEGNVLDRNTANENGSDGITVAKGGHTIVDNIVRNNGGAGIAATGVNVDGGGNVATGNACSGVVCRAEWVPPETTITGRPDEPSETRSATFTFAGVDDVTASSALSFQCRLDGAAFSSCPSPKTYAGLSNGPHTFQVRAVDAAGNVDPEPASYTWTIDAPPIVCPEAITVLADIDSWVDQSSSSPTRGVDTVLRVHSRSSSRNARALVRFPLPTVEGCVMQSATLRLFALSATTGRTLRALRVSGTWTENGVTWGNQPSTTGTAATTTSNTGYREWNVTSQVQAMSSAGANRGFLIRDASEGASGTGAMQQFRSREASANPPELVIRFVAGP